MSERHNTRRRVICVLVGIGVVCAFFTWLAVRDVTVVESGFVFVEGKYVEGPYTITTRGNTLRVNDYVVYRVRKQKLPTPPDGKIDPGVPDWVTAETTFSELIKDDEGHAYGLPFQKWAYLCRHHPPEEAVDGIVAYLEGLPCIKSVRLDTPNQGEYYAAVLVDSVSDREYGLIFLPPDWHEKRQASLDKERRKGPGKTRDRLVKNLENNSAIFMHHNHGGCHLMGDEMFIRKFPAIILIMKTDLPTAEKVALLKKLDFYSGAEELVANFADSPQLQQRLLRQAREKGITPMTLQEAIDMPTMEERMRQYRQAETQSSTR